MRVTSFVAILVILAFIAPASAAPTTIFSETFDGTLDQATWRLGSFDQINLAGGNPGAYLRNPEFDSAVPTPSYVGPLPSPFFGDYRAANVTSLGLDVVVFSATFGVDNKRPMSLVLTSDMGTPDDPSDDCDVYTVGNKSVPRPGSGWHAFDFKVPSDATTLPAGWVVRGPCAGLSANDAWNAVITNVTHVAYPFADPDTFWFFQVWDLGIDNVRIQFAAR